jgi:hypothetical protein
MSLREVCRGEIHIAEETDGNLDDVGGRVGLARFQALADHFTWWIPNMQCLQEWVVAAGYSGVRHGATFTLPFTGAEGGVRHSVLHAGGGHEG